MTQKEISLYVTKLTENIMFAMYIRLGLVLLIVATSFISVVAMSLAWVNDFLSLLMQQTIMNLMFVIIVASAAVVLLLSIYIGLQNEKIRKARNLKSLTSARGEQNEQE